MAFGVRSTARRTQRSVYTVCTRTAKPETSQFQFEFSLENGINTVSRAASSDEYACMPRRTHSYGHPPPSASYVRCPLLLPLIYSPLSIFLRLFIWLRMCSVLLSFGCAAVPPATGQTRTTNERVMCYRTTPRIRISDGEAL